MTGLRDQDGHVLAKATGRLSSTGPFFFSSFSKSLSVWSFTCRSECVFQMCEYEQAKQIFLTEDTPCLTPYTNTIEKKSL